MGRYNLAAKQVSNLARPVNSPREIKEKSERVSRKGAKTQTQARKEQIAFKLLACFLCDFAPLREISCYLKLNHCGKSIS
jgi:hypothetical protein